MSKIAQLGKALRAVGKQLRQPLAPPQPKIGVALGGGFARGLTHIGVLKVLEEEDIPIAYVAGTSVGAVIGAAYCSGISARELQEIASLIRFKDFARWTLSRYGFCSNDRMEVMLRKFLRCRTFEELRLPLAVAATDFNTGDDVVLSSGELIDAVRASSAYPGMFQPVEIGGRLLIDGALSHSVPAIPLRQMGAEKVIAVYLSAHWVSKTGPRHPFDVVGQCFSIAQAKLSKFWRCDCDVLLEPDVAGFKYDDFVRAPELVRVGEEAARAALPQIREWLGRKEPVAEAPPVTATPLKPPLPA